MSELTERAQTMIEGITPGDWRITRSYPDYGYDVGLSQANSLAGDRGLMLRKLNDAAFIAAAPELVRGLLVEVEALRELLREFAAFDELPPGWVAKSINTEPLDICGYCGALANYIPVDTRWHADHYDDCPVALASALLLRDK